MRQDQESIVVEIRPANARTIFADLREIVSNIELIWILALRAIQVRYKQSIVGILWVVLQPVITTAIFTFVFGMLARIPSDNIPYPVFVFPGLLLWQYFSRVVTDSSSSLVMNVNIITKVFFPRLILPLVPVISSAIDFFLAFTVVIVMMVLYGVPIGVPLVMVPVILVLTGLFAYAIGLILAPLNALYRDIGVGLPLILQIVMYVSPVIYPVSIVPERLQWLYGLNPMAALIDGMRAAVIGTPVPDVFVIGVVVVIMVSLFFAGLRVFRSLERSIVDLI